MDMWKLENWIYAIGKENDGGVYLTIVIAPPIQYQTSK